MTHDLSQSGGRPQRAVVWALVALWLAAIVAANLTLTHFGPGWILPNAFFLIGLDFITRDQVEDYAARKGLPVAEVERWLAANLAYE